MPLRVESYASYLTAPGKTGRRGIDYDANDLIHAVKREDLRGSYANIGYRGKS